MPGKNPDKHDVLESSKYTITEDEHISHIRFICQAMADLSPANSRGIRQADTIYKNAVLQRTGYFHFNLEELEKYEHLLKQARVWKCETCQTMQALALDDNTSDAVKCRYHLLTDDEKAALYRRAEDMSAYFHDALTRYCDYGPNIAIVRPCGSFRIRRVYTPEEAKL